MNIVGCKTRNSKKLNILCGSTHERYQTNLAATGHNFYSFRMNEHFKIWDNRYAKMPENYIEYKSKEIPFWLDFDLILTQHKFGQYQALSPIAQQLQIPLISLEHTTYVWPDDRFYEPMNKMRGHINVFITEHSVNAWKWKSNNDTVVIRHGIDTNLFKPSNKQRKNHILKVANDFIGRDAVLNYRQFCEVTKGLPVRIVGDTPGLSKPAKDLDDLINEYQTSLICINTAHLSPIPMNILEAAACGCAIVSCDTCGISEFFTNGHDAFLCKNSKEMRDSLQLLLIDEELAIEMGKRARATIINKCSMSRFINEWNNIFTCFI